MKLLSIAAALATLALTPARGDFATQKTNRVNLALANVCDGNFRDFRFQVSGYDDQAFVFNYDTVLTDLACTFRLTKPMDGTVYLDVPLTQITVAGTSVTFQIARTNIPPPGNYYGELLSFQANSTNYYRSLAQGTLPVTWSLYLNESNFFQRATNAAGVGQVYVHPNWIDPPWLSTNAALGNIYYTIANSLLLSGYVDAVYATIGPLQAATNYLSVRNTALTAGTNNLNTRVTTLEGIEGGASWSQYPATQNVNMAGFTMSNAVFTGNGSGLTNITAATTAGVNSVSATGAVSGNLVFEGSGVTQTNGTFNFNAGVTSVTDLVAATNALNTRVGAVETATNALDVRVTATESATNVLNSATNSLDVRVTANTAATNALDVRVLATETATGVLNTAVGALQTATNALDVRAGAAEAATNALNTRAGAIETATNALTVRMGAVETATGALDVAVGALNTATGALNTASANLATATQELVAATGALNTAVGSLNTASNAHQVRIAAVEAGTNALNTRVGTLETGGTAAKWSQYPATQNVNFAGYSISNVLEITAIENGIPVLTETFATDPFAGRWETSGAEVSYVSEIESVAIAAPGGSLTSLVESVSVGRIYRLERSVSVYNESDGTGTLVFACGGVAFTNIGGGVVAETNVFTSTSTNRITAAGSFAGTGVIRIYSVTLTDLTPSNSVAIPRLNVTGRLDGLLGDATNAIAGLQVATNALDTLARAALPKAGGTMTGAIDMGGYSVTNAGDVVVTNAVWLPVGGRVYFGTATNYIEDQAGTNYLFMAGTNSANFGW